MKTGFVHHTVNANNYTAAQVPALLRGIYAYHTQSRGWRDIGYNYLVDRFGRIWEGRWGGVDRAVVGAHTLGYNEVSFAMSAIGNFDIAQPPQAVLDAYARLFAWKLSLYNIRADQTNILVKGRYLNAINGHRDVGQTACPGRYLYAKIPWIRTKARAIQVAAQSGGRRYDDRRRRPTPPVFTSPTQTARAGSGAAAARSRSRAASNLAGSAYPDLVLRDVRRQREARSPTGGQTGYRAPVTTRGRLALDDAARRGRRRDRRRQGRRARSARTAAARPGSTAATAPATCRSAGHRADHGRSARPTCVVAAGDCNGDGTQRRADARRKNGGLYLVRGLGARHVRGAARCSARAGRRTPRSPCPATSPVTVGPTWSA